MASFILLLGYEFNTFLFPLIHHKDAICCVAVDRFSLRRISYTPQSALLGALHLAPFWCPGIAQDFVALLILKKSGGGFGFLYLQEKHEFVLICWYPSRNEESWIKRPFVNGHD
jgi:hypothetical protein